jgi:hypothetical protein
VGDAPRAVVRARALRRGPGEAEDQYILPSRDLIASDLEVSPAELGARRAELPPLRAPGGCGWLSVYARSVAPLGAGATLGAGVGSPAE